MGVVGLGGPFVLHHFGVRVIGDTYVEGVERGILM